MALTYLLTYRLDLFHPCLFTLFTYLFTLSTLLFISPTAQYCLHVVYIFSCKVFLILILNSLLHPIYTLLPTPPAQICTSCTMFTISIIISIMLQTLTMFTMFFFLICTTFLHYLHVTCQYLVFRVLASFSI